MRLPPAQSQARHPLSRLFASGGNVRVLRALFSHGGPLSVAQLARDTGLTPQGVRLVLDGLVAQRMVLSLGEPRAQLFAVDLKHPLTGTLRALFAAEKARWEELLASLRSALQANGEVEAAWYYGSVARGEDDPASDFDLAVVSRSDDAERVVEAVREALEPLEERLMFSSSVIGLSRADIGKLARDADPWWRELVRDAKVLVGERPERLAERALGSPLAA